MKYGSLWETGASYRPVRSMHSQRIPHESIDTAYRWIQVGPSITGIVSLFSETHRNTYKAYKAKYCRMISDYFVLHCARSSRLSPGGHLPSSILIRFTMKIRDHARIMARTQIITRLMAKTISAFQFALGGFSKLGVTPGGGGRAPTMGWAPCSAVRARKAMCREVRDRRWY